MAEVDDEVVEAEDYYLTTVPMATSHRAIMIIAVSDREDQVLSYELVMVVEEVDDEVEEVDDDHEPSDEAIMAQDEISLRQYLRKTLSVSIRMAIS